MRILWADPPGNCEGSIGAAVAVVTEETDAIEVGTSIGPASVLTSCKTGGAESPEIVRFEGAVMRCPPAPTVRTSVVMVTGMDEATEMVVPGWWWNAVGMEIGVNVVTVVADSIVDVAAALTSFVGVAVFDLRPSLCKTKQKRR